MDERSDEQTNRKTLSVSVRLRRIVYGMGVSERKNKKTVAKLIVVSDPGRMEVERCLPLFHTHTHTATHTHRIKSKHTLDNNRKEF